MNITLMRRTDYWLGIPLCFLLSAWEAVSAPLRIFKKKNRDVSRILLVELSEMGAVILAYPLIQKLKKEFPAAEVFFLTFARNKGVFELLDAIPSDRVLTIRDTAPWSFFADTLRVVIALRRLKIDLAVDLELFSRFTSIIVYLSGAARRAGFYRYRTEGLYCGELLTHRVNYNGLLHMAESYRSLAHALRAPAHPAPGCAEKAGESGLSLPQWVPPAVSLARMRERLRAAGVSDDARIILINPGEGVIPAREWPVEHFIALLGLFLKDASRAAILVGTNKAARKARVICRSRAAEGRCVDFTDQTTLPEVATLMTMAEALIANDCGLAHVASLTPVKKFIFFGPESPIRYRPLGPGVQILSARLACSPCLSAFNHRDSACTDNRCLKMITPEAAYAAITSHLTR